MQIEACYNGGDVLTLLARLCVARPYGPLFYNLFLLPILRIFGKMDIISMRIQ